MRSRGRFCDRIRLELRSTFNEVFGPSDVCLLDRSLATLNSQEIFSHRLRFACTFGACEHLPQLLRTSRKPGLQVGGTICYGPARLMTNLVLPAPIPANSTNVILCAAARNVEPKLGKTARCAAAFAPYPKAGCAKRASNFR
jgi:hypothetical protein